MQLSNIAITIILFIGTLLISYYSRDLKVENVVFEGESIESGVKVIDFGRSKIVKKREILTEKAGSVLIIVFISLFLDLLCSS